MIPKGIRIKFWFFGNYWWILIVAAVVVAGIMIWMFCSENQVTTPLTLLGSCFSLLYFSQKQKLEELQVFRSLFKEFNERYDKMNNAISDIADKGDENLEDDERKILVDYFNLCAEEYLYFSKGYIDPKVWTAWYNGMKENVLKYPRIKKFWRIESKTESYYGLSL